MRAVSPSLVRHFFFRVTLVSPGCSCQEHITCSCSCIFSLLPSSPSFFCYSLGCSCPLTLLHRFPSVCLGAKGLAVVAVSTATVQAPSTSLLGRTPISLWGPGLWCLAPLYSHPSPVAAQRKHRHRHDSD